MFDAIISWNDSFVRPIFAWIGNTSVLGIPLDIPAHIFGGAILYYLLAIRGYRTWVCVFIVVLLECVKELYDLKAVLLSAEYLEPAKDFLVTLVGAGLGYYLSRPVEEMLDKSEEK